jgi:hypothetical protein
MVFTRSQTHENPHLDDVEGQDNSVNSQLIMLLSKRERIVSSLGRIRNWFEKNGDASSSAIQVRLRDFANIKVQFDNVQTEVEAVDDQVNELEHENNRQNFKDSYYDLYAALEDAVNKSNSSIAATSRPHTTGDVTNRGPISSLLQLAPIDIKPFSGHYTEWLPFFKTFRALVHDALPEPKFGKTPSITQLFTRGVSRSYTSTTDFGRKLRDRLIITKESIRKQTTDRSASRQQSVQSSASFKRFSAFSATFGSAVDSHNHIAVRFLITQQMGRIPQNNRTSIESAVNNSLDATL